MFKYNNAVEIAKNVYWVGEVMENDAFQCHAYLIVDDDESILIDSGSMLEFESVKRKVESIIPLKSIKYIETEDGMHEGKQCCISRSRVYTYICYYLCHCCNCDLYD